MIVILTAAEHAEVLRQIALWPECPTCRGTGLARTIALPVGAPCQNHDCVKGRIPGPIYLTVEGDPWGRFDMPNVKPPQRWVDATGPCETCEGVQSLGRHFYDPDEYDGPCPSCGTGIKQVELRVTCPNDHVNRTGWAYCSVSIEPDENGRDFTVTLNDLELA